MNIIKKEIIEIISHQPKNLGTWIKIDIVDNQNRKFQFGTKKKDGGETKAFTTYKQLKSTWDDNLMNGKPIRIVVDYNETPKSFTDPKTGKVVNYTQRTIIGFSAPREGVEDASKNNDIPVIDVDEVDENGIPF